MPTVRVMPTVRAFPSPRVFPAALRSGALVALLVAVALFGPVDRAQAAQRRIALVVGNSDYTSVPRLDNPSHDANLIAGTLKSIGFTLIGDGPQLDLDRATLERRIREFGRAIGDDTVALFYYSGHGLQIRGANYLVPVTANLAAASDVDFELIDLDVVLRQMEAAHSRLNIVILDACRNNPFGGRGLRDGSGGLAEVRAPRGTLISYATQPGGVARDGDPGGDSPYSLALATAMKTNGIDVFKAFNMVGVKVNQVTNGEQTPWVSSSPIDGEFYLAAPPGVAPAPETPTPPVTASTGPSAPGDGHGPPFPSFDREAIYWQSIQNTGKPEELASYLRQFPNGTFADLARTRLALLQAAPPPPTARASPDAPIGGAEIAEAQRLLAGMGLSRAGTDGRSDPRTTEAIRLFQRSAGLPETGGLTRPLLDALRQGAPPAIARAGALFALAGVTAHDGRPVEAIGLYEQGMKLDPRNPDAQREVYALRRIMAAARSPAVRPAPVAVPAPARQVPAPVAVTSRVQPVVPPPAVQVIRRADAPGAPGTPASGFSATAADSHGRRFSASSAGSESAAVGDALQMCHGAGDAAGCRVIAMGRGAGTR